MVPRSAPPAKASARVFDPAAYRRLDRFTRRLALWTPFAPLLGVVARRLLTPSLQIVVLVALLLCGVLWVVAAMKKWTLILRHGAEPAARPWIAPALERTRSMRQVPVFVVVMVALVGLAVAFGGLAVQLMTSNAFATEEKLATVPLCAALALGALGVGASCILVHRAQRLHGHAR